MSDEPRAYSFTCENEECLAIMVIYPHPDSPGLLDPFEEVTDMSEPDWETDTPDCPHCGGCMDLMAGDPVSHIIVGAKAMYR